MAEIILEGLLYLLVGFLYGLAIALAFFMAVK